MSPAFVWLLVIAVCASIFGNLPICLAALVAALVLGLLGE